MSLNYVIASKIHFRRSIIKFPWLHLEHLHPLAPTRAPRGWVQGPPMGQQGGGPACGPLGAGHRLATRRLLGQLPQQQPANISPNNLPFATNHHLCWSTSFLVLCSSFELRCHKDCANGCMEGKIGGGPSSFFGWWWRWQGKHGGGTWSTWRPYQRGSNCTRYCRWFVWKEESKHWEGQSDCGQAHVPGLFCRVPGLRSHFLSVLLLHEEVIISHNLGEGVCTQ